MSRVRFPSPALAGVLAFACAAALAGCGSKTETAATPEASTPSASGGSVPAVSKYDAGPRAGETPADAALAERGKGLFSTKGCTACHAQGKRLTGPDLAGVSMRRTHEWIEQQILDPARMVKEDPIARGLFATYALQMPKQGLTDDEVAAVIEFLKQYDQQAGLQPVAANP